MVCISTSPTEGSRSYCGYEDGGTILQVLLGVNANASDPVEAFEDIARA